MRKKEKFIRFLKEEGRDVFNKFIDNFNKDLYFRSRFNDGGKPNKSLNYYLTKTYVSNYISDAFSWYDTKEKAIYWQNLNIKWLRICYERNPFSKCEKKKNL